MTLLESIIRIIFMSKQIKPYPLRIDPSLREDLEKEAKANNRSLNIEIATRLKASFLTENEQFLNQVDLSEPDAMKRLEAIVDKLMEKKNI